MFGVLGVWGFRVLGALVLELFPLNPRRFRVQGFRTVPVSSLPPLLNVMKLGV